MKDQEKEPNVSWASIASKILDSNLINVIHTVLTIALLFSLAVILKIGFDLMTASPTIFSTVTQAKCYEVREIAGRVFKLNTCTGEIEEILLKQE